MTTRTEEFQMLYTKELPQVNEPLEFDDGKPSRRGVWVASGVMLVMCLMLAAIVYHSTDWSKPAVPQDTQSQFITHFPSAAPALVTLPPGEAITTQPAPAYVPPVTPKAVHKAATPAPVVTSSPSAAPPKIKPPPTPDPTVAATTTPPGLENDPPSASPTPTLSSS